MIQIKTKPHRLFHDYLTWINPLLQLSKGEIDVLASFLTLHYKHRTYDKVTLNELLFSDATKNAIRQKQKINTKLFNKLFDSLVEKGLILNGNELNPSLTKYPKDSHFKIFVSFQLEK